MSVVLACDLGGTRFRAALVDDGGNVLAESAIPGPALAGEAGLSEIDAAVWWQALVEAAAKLAAQAPEAFDNIRAVAICGVTRTQVFLGRDGRLLRPAMTFQDVRADGAAGRLRDRLRRHPEGARVNAFHPLARLVWLREAEEASFRALATVLEPKDYLNFRLTGVRASDPVSMERLRASAEVVDGVDALAAAGLTSSVIPPLLEPWQQVGPVLGGLPAPLDRIQGVPVFCGANDTWAAVLGLGAMRPGCAYNISGTTEVFGVVREDTAAAEGLLTVDWRGLFQLGGPGSNGADAMAWLLSLLGRGGGDRDVGADVAALLAAPRNAQPVLFLPYLQGERVPYWNPALRGAFVGLNRRHGAGDLAWAVLEGIAFLNRIVLERAEGALGQTVREIRFGGGGAANPVWCQVKADVCGRKVVVGAAREPGLLGSAILAWVGLGRFASLAAAQDRLVVVARSFAPDAARHAAYGALYGLYRQSEAALAPISEVLAAFSLAGPEG